MEQIQMFGPYFHLLKSRLGDDVLNPVQQSGAGLVGGFHIKHGEFVEVYSGDLVTETQSSSMILTSGLQYWVMRSCMETRGVQESLCGGSPLQV